MKEGEALVHQLAVATAVCTLALVSVGGVVTSTGAGLAVPDWPTSFGYGMFTFPLSKMVGGILYEHSHRLLGSLVGVLTLALVAVGWLRDRRPFIRRLTALALLLVVVQGVLGGLRVVWVDVRLAMVHAVVAQIFFGLIVALAVVTSRGWRETRPHEEGNDSRLWPFAAGATAIVFLQLIFGALVRHSQLTVWLHVGGALVVLAALAAVCAEAMRRHADERALLVPGQAMLLLGLAQLMVGVWAWVLRGDRLAGAPIGLLEATVPTIHVALGALILGAAVALSLLAWKSQPVPEKVNA
ncbi:MAG: COX15/CtaA family protein [Verrucomicrobia bacterium]|nr:COX15/CtaA family protein [Verrucomicrobiota bacterium]